MKRRSFIKSMGLGAAYFSLGNKADSKSMADAIVYRYPEVKSFKDVLTADGFVLVRVKFSSDISRNQLVNAGSFKVEGASVESIEPFNFESGDVFNPEKLSYSLKSSRNFADIFVLCLKDVSARTKVTISNNNQDITFKLGDILKDGYLQYKQDAGRIDVNFLLDKEIGQIELSEAGIKSNPENFSFHVFADPQGGDETSPANHPTRMKIHNAFIVDSVILSNAIPERPLFSLVVGDIVDSQGEAGNFRAMHDFLGKLNCPVLYEIGNHESQYSSKFEPGYNMDAFNNYFDAQKKMNGMEKILYSFNVGRWHFIVWPDPLRSYFWDNHPHYFQWLRADLEKHKDRPTMIFHHVPCHPVGISPFPAYLESTNIRRLFLDTITKHGNVKWVLSGHVHIPVKGSCKTACSIRGTNFVTLPAAGYRPRAFGEEDYFGGPTQGIAIVDIKGDDATVKFKTVMEEEVTYPDPLPEFDMERHKLWFNSKWEVKANRSIVNGSFNKGLEGWLQEYVYREDKVPAVVCEARKADGRDALYIYNRRRGYQVPGQDRLPQTINRITQVVAIEPQKSPVLSFDYKLDKDNCDLDGFCGGYVFVEGFSGAFPVMNMAYSANKAYANLIDKNTERVFDIHHFDLPCEFDWTSVSINLAMDFDSAAKGRRFDQLGIDRLVLTVGVWHINEGSDQPFGMYFTNAKLNIEGRGLTAKSNVGGRPINKKDPKQIWWLGKHIPFIHLAGEHRYHLETTSQTLFREKVKK